MNININYKTYTKPLVYSIEILELDKHIPEEEIEGFIEWLQSLPNEQPLGRGHEYYGYDEDYTKDIAVTFMIRCE